MGVYFTTLPLTYAALVMNEEFGCKVIIGFLLTCKKGGKRNHINNNSIQFNLTQFFIIYVLAWQLKSQLQRQQRYIRKIQKFNEQKKSRIKELIKKITPKNNSINNTMSVKEKFVKLNVFLNILIVPFTKGLNTYKHRIQTKKIDIRIYHKNKNQRRKQKKIDEKIKFLG